MLRGSLLTSEETKKVSQTGTIVLRNPFKSASCRARADYVVKGATGGQSARRETNCSPVHHRPQAQVLTLHPPPL